MCGVDCKEREHGESCPSSFILLFQDCETSNLEIKKTSMGRGNGWKFVMVKSCLDDGSSMSKVYVLDSCRRRGWVLISVYFCKRREKQERATVKTKSGAGVAFTTPAAN